MTQRVPQRIMLGLCCISLRYILTTQSPCLSCHGMFTGRHSRPPQSTTLDPASFPQHHTSQDRGRGSVNLHEADAHLLSCAIKYFLHSYVP